MLAWPKKYHLILTFIFAFFAFLFISAGNTYANHFRAGTMSWESVEGEDRTVLIKMQVGWTNNHGHIPTNTPIGGVVTNKLTLYFGDGTSINAALRVTSRNSTSNDVQTELVSIKAGDSDYTEGVVKTYASDGDYVAYWGSSARESALNLDGSSWNNQTLITIGGEYSGNSSPVSAVAAVVQVPDNTIFEYSLVGVDKDGDDVRFRYGTKQEFFVTGSGEATKPTGLVLDEDGSVTWDVRDGTLSTSIGNRWQMTVMVEDLDEEGNVKSYVPLDFVFLISDSSNEPPTITSESNSYSVGVGQTLEFSLTGNDPDWTDGDDSPTMSVVNPPSANSSIWSTSSNSTDDTTIMDVTFTPNSSMQGNNYVIVFQATDDGGNSVTKNISLSVNTPTPTPTASPTPTVQPTVVPTTVVDSLPPAPVCTAERVSAPTIVKMDAQSTKATVHFSTVGDFKEYVISYSTAPHGEEHTTTYTASSGHNQSVVINDLLPNTTYYIKVRAQNGCMPGDWSSIRSVVTTTSTSPSLFSTNRMSVDEVQVNTTLPSECTYTVLPGDTLWKLAEEAYEDGNRYQEIIDLNIEQFPNIRQVLTVGTVLQFPCESTNESLPHDHDEEGNNIQTYTNAVTIYVENNGVALGGVDVELHSDPQYGKTDEQGKVVFTNVEPGEHTLKLASGPYKAVQKITVDEGVKEFDVKISVNMQQSIWYQNWIFLVGGIVLGLICFWIFILFKKRKKNNDDKEAEK